MKKGNKPLDRDLEELKVIAKILSDEGQSEGEYRYKVFVASLLAGIDFSLHRISLSLFFLVAYVVGKAVLGLL